MALPNPAHVTYRFEPAPTCVMCGGTDTKTLGRRLNRHQGVRPRHKTGITVAVVQCRQCGLIYSNPRPLPASLEQHYDCSPEEYWEPGYLEPHVRPFGYYIERFRSLWGGTGTPRALDVGAGVGLVMSELEENGFESVGVEPSPAFRERAIERGIAGERLELAAVEDVDYERGSFDFVIFFAVLEHLRDPGATLSRALEWLAPSGLIFLAGLPYPRWLLGRALNILYRAQGLEFVTNLSPMHPPYHLYEFTPESLRCHGSRAGYEVVEYRVQPRPTLLPGRLSAVAEWVMNATATGVELQAWLRARGSS